MGNELLAKTKRQFNSKKYLWVNQTTTPFCIKVKDKHSNTKAQKHKIEYHNLQKDVNMYLLRNKYPQYLVAVYDIVQDQSNHICSVQHDVSVVIEEIPYRLCDLGALTLEEGLYVMTCVLRATQILKLHKVEFYFLDQTNICFNNRGECKYWINQNLVGAKPSPNIVISEREFIKLLWEIVGERINEVNDFFDLNLEEIQGLNVEKIRKLCDRGLEKSLVGIPNLTNIKSSQDVLANIDEKQLRSQKDERKLSLSNYCSVKRRANPHQKLIKKIEFQTEDKRLRNIEGQSSKKSSLHKQLTYCRTAAKTNKTGAMKIYKTNSNTLQSTQQKVHIDPFHSYVFNSPFKSTQRTTHLIGSPCDPPTREKQFIRCNFIYNSPVSTKNHHL